MNIGAIVHARLTSERFPAKQLTMIEGRPALHHQLDRIFACSYISPERVVVATTLNATDDALVPVVEATGARVFRGNETDLVDRWYHAVEAFGFDAVIHADGDDICVDPTYMDLALRKLLSDDELDVVLCEGLPLGLATKAIRRSAYERVWRNYLSKQNDTGAWFYFTGTDLCQCATVRPVSEAHCHTTARLTLDYPEDAEFFGAVFRELYRPGQLFGVKEIVALLRRRPELVAINARVADIHEQRSQDRIASEALQYRTATGTRLVQYPK